MDRSHPIGRLARHTALFLLTATLVGIVGLGVGEAVPDRWVADELHRAVLDGTLTDTAQARTRNGNISDHFTECIGLSIGLGEESNAGFLETLAENPHLGPCDRLIPAIHAYGGSGSLPTGWSYLRYWHGYTVITRPATAAVGVDGLRMIGFLGLITVLTGLALALRRVSGGLGAVALIAPIVATTDLIDLPASATQTIALAVGFGGAWMALSVADGALSVPRVWFAGLAAGAAFVYVDILTVVPGMWILPAAMTALVARAVGCRARQVAGWSMLSGSGWFFGYLGMWVGKWAFASIVLGPSRVRDDVRDTITERLSGDSVYVQDGFARATRRNFEFWFDRPLTVPLLVVASIVVFGVLVMTARRRDWSSLRSITAAASPAIIPIIWFEVANNHSQVHLWFTYRSLPIALGVILLAVATPSGLTCLREADRHRGVPGGG